MKRTALQRKTPMQRTAFKPAEPKTAGQSKPPRARKCKVSTCRKQFLPAAPFITWCSPECGAVLAQQQLAKVKAARSAAVKRAKKAERLQDRGRAEALKTLPQLLAEAQQAFNAWIRWRDRDQPCICCGRTSSKQHITGSSWDAGHYRSVGSAPQLRFEEDNVHKQLVYCNQYLAGNHIGYRQGLLGRIGSERLALLESNNAIHHWMKDEVRAIRDTYRARLSKEKKEAASVCA